MNRKWLLSGGSTVVAAGILSIMLFWPPATHRTVFAATQQSNTVHTGPAWGTRTLASLAEMVAKGAHDLNPTSSVYFVTDRGQSNLATSGARVDGESMPVDIVVMHGAFSNPKWSTAPLGAPTEKGNTLVVIVDAQNGSVVDMGMITQNTNQASAMVGKLSVLSARHLLTVTQNS